MDNKDMQVTQMHDNNKKVVIAAIKEGKCNLRHVSPELRDDYDVVLAAVQQDGNELRDISPLSYMYAEDSIVLAAVQNKGTSLQYADSYYSNDRKIVLAATQNDIEAIAYVSKELLNEPKFVYKILNQNFDENKIEQYNTLINKYLPKEIQDDINKKGLSNWMNEQEKKYSPEMKQKILSDLKEYKITAIEAVTQYGFNDDQDIVLTAMERNPFVLENISKELLENYDFRLKAVQIDSNALSFFPSEYRYDREIIMEAIKKDGYILQCAPERFKDDKEIVLAAVNSKGNALEYASNELKNDREVVLTALNQDCYAAQYASSEIKEEIARYGMENWLNGEIKRLESNLPPMGNLKKLLKAASVTKEDILRDIELESKHNTKTVRLHIDNLNDDNR